MRVLEAKNITKKFGGLIALNNLSLGVDNGAIIGLIGPNGSGKTTFINIATGFDKLTDGNFLFNKRRIDGLNSHQISKLGIGRTFQETRVFRKMTVLENVLVASQHGLGKKVTEEAIDLLNLFEIDDLRNEYAGNLSYGQQKLLELARVLMIDPQLILLDEPTSGINTVIIERMLECFRGLHDKGKTLIIVEHNIPVVFEVCETIIVLDHGQKIAEGKPEEIRENSTVQDAYLGGNRTY